MLSPLCFLSPSSSCWLHLLLLLKTSKWPGLWWYPAWVSTSSLQPSQLNLFGDEEAPSTITGNQGDCTLPEDPTSRTFKHNLLEWRNCEWSFKYDFFEILIFCVTKINSWKKCSHSIQFCKYFMDGRLVEPVPYLTGEVAYKIFLLKSYQKT